VGWFFEKLSILKIKVNYDKCIACGKCEKACPSTVMSAILRRDKKVIPDCFSCGACMNVCPTKAIDFKSGKRDKPTQNILAKLKKLDKGRK
jgi:ferredoxin